MSEPVPSEWTLLEEWSDVQAWSSDRTFIGPDLAGPPPLDAKPPYDRRPTQLVVVPKSVLVAERTRSEETEEKLAEAMREYDAAAHNCDAWSADYSRLEARSRELEDALREIHKLASTFWADEVANRRLIEQIGRAALDGKP